MTARRKRKQPTEAALFERWLSGAITACTWQRLANYWYPPPIGRIAYVRGSDGVLRVTWVTDNAIPLAA